MKKMKKKKYEEQISKRIYLYGSRNARGILLYFTKKCILKPFKRKEKNKKKRGKKRKGGKKEKREKKTDAIIRNSVRASRPGIPFRRLSFTSASALCTNRLAEALAGANNQRSFCNN